MSFRTILLYLVSVLLIFVSPCTVKAQSTNPRIKYTIDEHWAFIRHDLTPQKANSLDDSLWTFVNLPHTWNKDDAFDDKPGYYRGPAWYRKKLQIGSELKGKQLVLHFEGANQVADVYLNGEKVGHHVGGYTAFNINITDAVNFDADNTLSVRLDNSHNPDIPP